MKRSQILRAGAVLIGSAAFGGGLFAISLAEAADEPPAATSPAFDSTPRAIVGRDGKLRTDRCGNVVRVTEEQLFEVMADQPEPPRDEALDKRMLQIRQLTEAAFFAEHRGPITDEDEVALGAAVERAFHDAGIETHPASKQPAPEPEVYTEGDYARSEEIFDAAIAAEAARSGCR
ncbi:hypothetical protein KSP35_00430 [Aquihabitans sp. G128]|uniref:hypothetical protein n=1 Tax=Aquihabitans sp. G128 TaxID=2849779 RepID=UPI001C2198FF|nr:hypothetical protein [Aquihabitans sp. G128]QXC61358.1 hypothetical protein KSP35_00430 [Aquihabitans sp. G128]